MGREMTRSQGAGRRGRVGLFVALLGILALAGTAVWGLDRPLPAEPWNIQALRQIAAAGPGPLTFAVFGDSRNSDEVFPRLLRQVARDPGLSFAVHLGDLVSGGGEGDFRRFFQETRDHLPLPLLAVPGNHDLEKGGGPIWNRLFGPRYYAFEVRGHRLLVLDDTAGALDEGQLNWLEEELRQAQACRTRLVFTHLPLFDPRGPPFHHALKAEVGQKLALLFQQYRVTHIFAGHIHGYFTGQWSGVPYTITGGGGVKLAGTDPEHYFHHYLKVGLAEKGIKVQVQRLAQAP
jgi:3',5'-cyclic AMP phosphodiesterase CpdA